MRTISSFLIAALLLLTAACTGGDSGAEQTNVNPGADTDVNVQNVQPTAVAVSASPTIPVDANNNPLVARVNGVGITQSEFDRALARRQLETNAADPAALANTVMDALVEQELIDQAAANLQLSIGEAELDAEVQAYIELAGGKDAWETWLNENLYTEDEYRDTLRTMMINGLVQGAIVSDVSGDVRHVHARHILVTTEEEANQVLARLQAGEDFGALAAELSKDVTSSQQGGDLGWFTEGELLEPALAQVAFSLLPNQIAGPVATRLGYHVIQTLEFADRPVAPEKVALLAQIQFEEWLQTQRDSATIEYYR